MFINKPTKGNTNQNHLDFPQLAFPRKKSPLYASRWLCSPMDLMSGKYLRPIFSNKMNLSFIALVIPINNQANQTEAIPSEVPALKNHQSFRMLKSPLRRVDIQFSFQTSRGQDSRRNSK